MAQDAIALLEADHHRVEELFKDFKAANGNPQAKFDIAQAICMELTLHAMVEEEIFYPAYQAATGDQEMVGHATEEHQKVKDLIAKVPEAGNLDGAVEALMKHVLHHVEDERKGMFKKARECGMELATVGGRIQTRRAEVATAVQDA